jgi:hypothetical protein
MTGEELEEQLQKTAARITELAQQEEPLTKQQKNFRHMLRLQQDALERIKAAKARGDQRTEIRAGIDYTVYREYEHRHPFIVFLVKARTRWYEI